MKTKTRKALSRVSISNTETRLACSIESGKAVAGDAGDARPPALGARLDVEILGERRALLNEAKPRIGL